MPSAASPEVAAPIELPLIDERLVWWLACEAIADRYARLVDGGADVGVQVELAALFIDLPAVPHRSHRKRRDPSEHSERAGQPRIQPAPIMQMLLSGDEPSDRYAGSSGRWLLVGGPGSGKSTVTQMFAQQLRVAWLERLGASLPVELGEPWRAMVPALAGLATDQGWRAPSGVLPLRINLPHLARWMTSQDPTQSTLWSYVTHRVVHDLDAWERSVELSAPVLRAALEIAPIMWILDGLDEVPATAGRADMIELVRATVCSDERACDRVLVSTRPQGYGGEFDDLDELELRPLPRELASAYAERLMHAWYRSNRPTLDDRLDRLRTEIAKADVSELLQTPLHTTMAAVLIANRGSLPAARHRLFDHYFQTIWRRELDKPLERTVEDNDEQVVRALHERAGLTLHVRSQVQEGARASLRRRELREMLAALFSEYGHDEGSARHHVDRLMRFAAERLVLLLHSAQGEYEFGVRSLQEYFAAGALLDGEPEMIRARLEAVVLNPHWSNVLAFVVSEAALRTNGPDRNAALSFIVELCRGLNDGTVGGSPAARCSMGSRLAMHILAETERYGHPWLHAPLWEIALAAATAPVQQRITYYRQIHPGSGNGWADSVELHTRLGMLVGAWSNSQADGLRARVLALAEAALSAQKPDAVERGWRLLHGLLLAQIPEAVALADRHAPQTRDEGRDLVGLLLGGPVTPAPAWLGEYVDRRPEFFLLFHPISRNSGSHLESHVFELTGKFRTNKQICLIRDNQEFCLTSLSTHQDEGLIHQVPLGPSWTRWRQLAAFLDSPSHLGLADVLDALDDDSFHDFRVGWSLPWPLEACLLTAQSLDELRSFSAKLRNGQLGTADDWAAAELRWRANPYLTTDDLVKSINCRGPWNHDIRHRGVPFMNISGSVIGETLGTLLSQLELEGDLSANQLHLVWRAAIFHVVPLRVLQRVERLEGGVWPLPNLASLQAGLESSEREDWFGLLERRGQDGPTIQYQLGYSPQHAWDLICERLRTRPEQSGLIEILRALVSSRRDLDLSKLVLPPLPDDAPAHLVAAHVLLRLAVEPVETAKLQTMLKQIEGRIDVLDPVLGYRNESEAITILLATLDRFPESEHRDALLAALYDRLRRTPAAFAHVGDWIRYVLPAPYLGLAPPPPNPARLRSITELSNIRLFKTTPIVDTPFPTPPADRGQWIVLVGENGAGKTTLLRALALALASPPVASKLLDERLPMVRNGASGRIAIDLDSGPLSVLVSRQGRTEQVESPTPDAYRPWVVGYGVRRGNARGEPDRGAEPGALGELHTLFDRPASLHNAVQWIADLEADVLRERNTDGGTKPGPREQVWRAVQRALAGLLKISKIDVATGGMVFVEHPQFGRVRLEALSDGYLTTAGWVIDMIARWVDRQYELDEPIGPQVLQQMCGFVLLDEIDLHLHPTWQWQIIDDIRHQFPRLSFVVTTHNPLTLQGARRGEVYIMRRDGEHIELTQRDIRPGHDVDRVLLEQFGLEHTFDKETRQLLEHHRKLVEAGVSLDHPERASLEIQLRERFGDVGDIMGTEREINHGRGGPLTAEERERFLSDHDAREH